MTIGIQMGFGRVGTPGTSITAIEAGHCTKRRTTLIVTAAISLVTTPDVENLAGGALIYTFPPGQVIVHRVYGDVGIDIDDNINDEDTPEVGLGTVVAAGANATLGDAASGITAENIWGPHVVTGCDYLAVAADAIQVVSTPELVIAGAGVHTVYLNLADAWADGAGTADAKIEAGRFIIDWTILPIEGV